MVSLATLFWNICILRVGPESVPARTWFALVLVVANIAVALAYHYMLMATGADTLSTLQALGFSLVSITTTAALTRFVLSFRRLDERFLATLTALIGTDLLIGVLTVVASQLCNLVGLPPGIATGILQIWVIVVWGFIYHRAFNITLLFGILMAFGIIILAFIVGVAAVNPLV